jgi:Na+(H+)/acetate symporter ActP
MSTFSGLLVSMTGALAHDVYGRMLRPKSTPEQRMRMFKVAAVIIGGVAILLGSRKSSRWKSTSWSARPSPSPPRAISRCSS